MARLQAISVPGSACATRRGPAAPCPACSAAWVEARSAAPAGQGARAHLNGSAWLAAAAGSAPTRRLMHQLVRQLMRRSKCGTKRGTKRGAKREPKRGRAKRRPKPGRCPAALSSARACARRSQRRAPMRRALDRLAVHDHRQRHALRRMRRLGLARLGARRLTPVLLASSRRERGPLANASPQNARGAFQPCRHSTSIDIRC